MVSLRVSQKSTLHFRNQRSAPIPGAGTIEKRLEALFESERCLSFDPRTLIVDLLKAPLRVRAQIAQRLQEQLGDAGKRQPKTIVANTRAESNNANNSNTRNNNGGTKRKSNRSNGNRNSAKVNNAKAVVSSQFSNFPNFEKTLQQPGGNANQQQQQHPKQKQVLTKVPVQQFTESNTHSHTPKQTGNRNQVL